MDSLLDLDCERGLAGRQRVARGGSGIGRALQVCSCAPLKETPWAMTRRSCHRDCCPGAGANERQLRLRLHILLSLPMERASQEGVLGRRCSRLTIERKPRETAAAAPTSHTRVTVCCPVQNSLPFMGSVSCQFSRWASPSAFAHHHTKRHSRRPLAMATFAKLPQVADHRCWAASSLGSIANRSDEPGEPVLIPLPCYL